MLEQFAFAIALTLGIGLFIKNLKKILRNIQLGKAIKRNDSPRKRWLKMSRIALGQSKMVLRPVAGILHIIVYIGFFIVNIEIIEILIDGLFGTHRILSRYENAYAWLTQLLEGMAILVIIAISIFAIRRNLLKIPRFQQPEMKSWPKTDANLILLVEFILMVAFLAMNAADYYAHFQRNEILAGSYPFSIHLFSFFQRFSNISLIFVERISWWLHFLGILFFLNYLYYSKHLHILLAFPNVWFSKLTPAGEADSLLSVKKEVDVMLNPSIDPYAIPATETSTESFGAQDIFDLNRVQLLNAYACTECGRCSAVCPANITGRKLSPRKIMMEVRDRLEEVGKNINKNGKFLPDGKRLLDDYISQEEIWACTTCNACAEACPISIDPLSVILDLRRFAVMEESNAPAPLNAMMQNIENNGAPWQFSNADRLNWADSSQ